MAFYLQLDKNVFYVKKNARSIYESGVGLLADTITFFGCI